MDKMVIICWKSVKSKLIVARILWVLQYDEHTKIADTILHAQLCQEINHDLETTTHLTNHNMKIRGRITILVQI